MAKRLAGSQITKDRNDESDGDYDVAPPLFQMATAEVMARRKIARPGKSRHQHAPIEPHASFGSLGNGTQGSDVDFNSKITALNKRFLESVLQYQSTVNANQLVNLIPVCQKYIDYYNSIKPAGTSNGINSSTSTSTSTSSNGAPKSLFSGVSSHPPQTTAATTITTVKPPMLTKPTAPVTVGETLAAPKLNAFSGISSGVTAPSFSFGSTASASASASGDSKPNPFSGISTGLPASTSAPKTGASLFSFGKTDSSAPISASFSTSNPSSAPAPISTSASLAPASAPVSKPSAEVVEVSSSDESLDDEVKVEGPKFVLNTKPTVKNSPFTFGPKPVKKKDDSDSDLDSEIEIKGPTFTFNKPIKDSVFKFKPQQTENTAENDSQQTKPVFAFGQSSTSAASIPEEPASKPVFSFGQKDNKPAVAPSAPAPEKPAFSFGTTSNTGAFGSSSTLNADKPIFNFATSSSAPQASDGASSDQPKPSFSFGASAATKSDDKPAFSFGSSTAGDGKPAFSFAPNGQKSDELKPTLSFGGAKPFTFNSTASASATAAPSSSSSSSTSKPAFSFTTQTPAETTSTAPPAFPFNSTTEKKEENKPAFLFGASSTTTPGFGSSAPSFNFGGANASNGGSLFGGQSKPGFGFSFGSGSASLGVSTSAAKEDNKEGEAVEESESTAKFTPIVKLTEEVASTTGEENESVAYTKRAKLMLFQKDSNNEPYKTIGLGDLKVLKHNDTGKLRILVRSDGGQRVLLNTFVDKQMKYDTIGNGSMVRVPVINPETKALDTYVVRVKTAGDGKEFLESLQLSS